MSQNEDQTDYYKKWETDRVIDARIKEALKEYDISLWEKIGDKLKIELSNIRSWISVNKFVVVAVALLLIGTLYQLFVSVANTVGLK